jgi:hypothetical protein
MQRILHSAKKIVTFFDNVYEICCVLLNREQNDC